MSAQGKKIQLEGTVYASRYDPSALGKQFLGAAIECSDATVWVIDYEEQSPFHVFTGRQVIATGEPYEPDGQYLVAWGEGKTLGHFRVSNVRPVVASDVELVEVGAGYRLRGRVERSAGHPGEPVLSFVSDRGDVFLATNDPGHGVEGVRPITERENCFYSSCNRGVVTRVTFDVRFAPSPAASRLP